MFNALMKLFRFLFPIVRTALLQVAADEINKKAYPSGKGRIHFDYSRQNKERLDALRYADLKPGGSKHDCPECGRSLGTPHYSTCSQFVDFDSPIPDESLEDLRRKLTGETKIESQSDLNAYDRAYSTSTGNEIDRPVILAIEIAGKDMQDRQKKLWEFMTTVLEEDDSNGERFKSITGFWIAEDERYHGSEDLDSAIFVPKGEQRFWADVKTDRIANGEGMNGHKL